MGKEIHIASYSLNRLQPLLGQPIFYTVWKLVLTSRASVDRSLHPCNEAFIWTYEFTGTLISVWENIFCYCHLAMTGSTSIVWQEVDPSCAFISDRASFETHRTAGSGLNEFFRLNNREVLPARNASLLTSLVVFEQYDERNIEPFFWTSYSGAQTTSFQLEEGCDLFVYTCSYKNFITTSIKVCMGVLWLYYFFLSLFLFSDLQWKKFELNTFVLQWTCNILDYNIHEIRM